MSGQTLATEPLISADLEALVQRPFVLQLMRHVAAFQAAEYGGAAPLDWKAGTYFTGVFAAYLATRDPAFRREAQTWCEAAGWKVGGRPFYADDICMGQTMLDLYLEEPAAGRIEHLRGLLEPYFTQRTLTAAEVHSHIRPAVERPMRGRELWWWCDALYMAPPVLARMARATGEIRYLDRLHALYWDAVEFLFDPDVGLFFRDEGFMPAHPAMTAEREKRFWSRGNGWVYAGLVRIIDYLPEEDPQRERYLALYRRLTRKLIGFQQADGLWRSWLNRPDFDPTPEVSGSSFVAFGLLAGVRRGWLERKSHLPVALRAWRGLVGKVDLEGRLGFAQLVDSAPGPVRPESFIDYTHGAFLLAASEVYALELDRDALRALVPAPAARQFVKAAAWSNAAGPRAFIADQHLYLAGRDGEGGALVYAYRLDPPHAPSIGWGPTRLGATAAGASPALLRFEDRLVVAYPKTGDGWAWRIAPVPRELPGWGPLALAWSEERVLAAAAPGGAAIALAWLPGPRRLHAFYEVAGAGLDHTWSDDGAETWAPAQSLVEGGADGPPLSFRVTDNGRDAVDLVLVSRAAGSDDGALRHIRIGSGNGSASGLPRGVSVDDLAYDPRGQLRVAFTTFADGAWRHAVAEEGALGEPWTMRVLGFAHGPAQVALDPASQRVLYVSTDVDPTTGKPNATGRFQILRGRLEAPNTPPSWEPLTFDAACDNVRPVVSRGSEGKARVIWERRAADGSATELCGIEC